MKRPSKAEARRLRQAEKAEKSKDKSIRLSALVADSVKAPRTAEIAPLRREPRLAAVPDEVKAPKIAKEPYEEILGCTMTWCHTHSDVEGVWSWDEPRAWSDEEWANDIQPKMAEMARLTWQNILNDQKVPAKGDKLVPRHHHQDVGTLVAEAQARWQQHKLDEYDTAFRFRFSGTLRAWGVRLRGHFYLVWWDRYHKIYPVDHS